MFQIPPVDHEQVFLEATIQAIPRTQLAHTRPDPIEASLAFNGVVSSEGWKAVKANKDGWFDSTEMESGYARFEIPSDREEVVFLHAQGNSFSYVNGEPHVGDVYGTGYVWLPVKLKKGMNEVLLKSARGGVRLGIVRVLKPVSLQVEDSTLPDQLPNDKGLLWGAVVIRNASEKPINDLVVESAGPDRRRIFTRVGPVAPLSVKKVPFQFAPSKASALSVSVSAGKTELDSVTLLLRNRSAKQTYRRTFVSRVDHSVQYFAINPAQGDNPTGLALSLHGASVEAQGQADAYGPKSWLSIAAATNRRPYGYDWEDWGRIDALEVFDIAKKTLPHDPHREYLLGHSMGGHGTWQVGTLYADQFGAIAPSAGWITSYGYAGALRLTGDDVMSRMLTRANLGADTALMAKNLQGVGVYILHGDADATVPVAEARAAAKNLATFHKDWVLTEIPKADHWYDNNPEPGADAVDYAPMIDFLSRHSKRSVNEVRFVDFTTFNPQVSGTSYWATIEQQEREQELSELHLEVSPSLRKFSGSTVNVQTLTLSTAPLLTGTKIEIEIDGCHLIAETPKGASITVSKQEGKWSLASAPAANQKNPRRYGPLRLGIDQHFLFVVGTSGTPEENQWLQAKARYDAETWWYRGNGSVDVVLDRDYSPKKFAGRSVVLYGNQDTNRAWPQLLADSPVEVHRGSVRLGQSEWKGSDLGAVFVRPLKDSSLASVVVIASTGTAGQFTLNNLGLWQPMIDYPDVLVLRSSVLKQGNDGIVAAGFFGLDWSLKGSDIVTKP